MCKQKSAIACLNNEYIDYKNAATPFWNTAKSSTNSKTTRVSASEMLGELAAIAFNARRLKLSFNTSRNRHVTFSGRDVFDLAYLRSNGRLEIKEAKGGTGKYGIRKSFSGKKKVRQCTPSYNKTMAKKMMHSKYKGKNPTVACANCNAPNGNCNACITAERNRRRHWGALILQSIRNRTIEKLTIRGGYSKTCLQPPKEKERYEIDVNGDKISYQTVF